ncbi:DUF2797 domain-containing protein [Streptomyces sp. NPDC018031]|uniref:DUF2797 domain-containing protein n=1 Tax=Streptomyces sp. NPDC018031 TaxID=3365033 RepID=UPI00378A8A8B
MTWSCAGLRWHASGAVLVWHHPAHGERTSPLSPGRPLSFRTGSHRGCAGVRRGARHTPCPDGAEVPVSAVSAQCPECARLDRGYSVAADTRTDDPRPYDVYLAWFAPGLIKVGITAAERDGARLREQGALSYAPLGRGPLMAARRAEAVLGVALGVPDRFPYAAKRAARLAPPAPAERAGELRALHERACALPGLPETLTLLPGVPVHHDEVFGLDRLRRATPVAGLLRLAAGRTVAGVVVAVAGPDLYLAAADGRTLLLDVRQLTGWPLAVAAPGAGVTAEVVPAAPAVPETDALF